MSVNMQTLSLAHMSAKKFKSRWKKSDIEPTAMEKNLLCKTQGEALIV
jgi:hypothetical protein